MKKIIQTSRFKKDLKRMKKRDKDEEKLFYTVEILVYHGQLPASFRPHKLSGRWENVWECHIEPDWLLIYYVTKEEITLVRTGTHADLF